MSRVVIQSPAPELTKIQQRALNSLPPRVAEALSRFCDGLLARFGDQILRVILYGSFARGEAHAESDVDVMVVVGWDMPRLPDRTYLHLAGDPRRKEIVGIAYDVTLECGPYLSPFVADEALFQKGRDAIREARREGIELYHHPSTPAFVREEITAAHVLKDAPAGEPYAVDPGDLEDIDLWLSMADDDLQVARDLYRDAHYRRVVASVYYAMFYAAKAALLAAGVSVKSHEGAISEFGRVFTATGRVEGRYGKMLAERYKDRLDSDYKLRFLATQESTAEALRDAEAFIAKARVLVEEELSKRGSTLT